MKLSEKEAVVLANVELDADLTLEELGRRCKYPVHVVRYYIKRLEDRGVIRRSPVVNLVPAGYSFFGIYFSLAPQRQTSVSRLISDLQQDTRVVWLAELGGDFQYGLALCVEDIYAAQGYLEELANRFPALFFDKAIAIQFSATFLQRGYLGAKHKKSISIKRTEKTVELDELDRRILSALTHMDYNSNRALAKTLALPVSTLDLRIKKLEEKGIICGYIYDVDANQFGMQVHTLLIFAKGLGQDFSDALREFAKDHPAVTRMYACLGSWDFELSIEVKEGRQIARITQELYERFGVYINTIRVLAKYRELKYTHTPF